MKKLIVFSILTMALFISSPITVLAAEQEAGKETVYVTIEPYLITNFVKKNGRLGFLNSLPRIVTTKEDEALVDLHMPLIKNYMVEFLSAIPEEKLTDPAQRAAIQKEATAGLQKIFEDETGKKVVNGILFKKFLTM
jgi:flagellar FliL protein